MSARTALRAATAAKHDAVDAAFGGFDLTDPASYARFLTAHARALPAVEAALASCDTIPAFAPRTELLRADLLALGLDMPAPLPLAPPENEAAAFGALYVIEGSRLGGGMLAKQVPDALPRAYLSAVHQPGGWRAFGEVLDRAEKAGGPGWIDRATAAAEATFDLYAEAARAA
jgi:heme oxygenase (biliverdin-IX-beta and delta-forming)